MSARISVVVPVYACAPCLDALCTRLHAVLDGMGAAHEIILVDDRSPDNGWDAINAMHAKFTQVRGVRLSRNYGQQIAIAAGLAQAKGDYVVVMDCDLQDPPEKIPELFATIQQGYDIVLARRATRGHSGFRRLAGKFYFALFSKLTEEKVDGSYGSFSMLRRKVVEAYLQFGERDRHYLFILRWLGFAIGSIEYDQAERTAGKSSYSLRRLIRHAIDGLFFQATVLLRWIVTLGLLFAFIGTLLAIYFIVQYFAGTIQPGWTSLTVLLLISTGAILTSLGVVGLYIGKIFEQTKGRPLYVLDTITRESPL